MTKIILTRARCWHALVFVMTLCAGSACSAWAQESEYSVQNTGIIGLSTVPSARMDEAGTIRAGVSTQDPYNHMYIGMQIANPLYVNLRQSMLVSSVLENPKAVYPGMDIKLRLRDEGRYAPAIAFGANSILGHRRFSSEYFTLSKRIYDFDVTAGLAWGRMGDKGGIGNPFKTFSSHFGKERDRLSEDASTPSDWFSGEQIGFFGGVEYFTPVPGLSMKADFNAESYGAEKSMGSFNAPSPWSVGINYSPHPFVSVGASAIGTDKIMARLSFQGNPAGWDLKSYKNRDESPDLYTIHSPDFIFYIFAKSKPFNFGEIREDGSDYSAVLHLNDYQPVSMQVGRAARELLKNAPGKTATITIIPVTKGLRGKAVRFSKRDISLARRNRISPEELWQDVQFIDDDRSISRRGQSGVRKFKFHPELSFSLGEDETSHLYRTSAVIETRKEHKYGFLSGTDVRVNIANNLHRMERYLDVNLKSVRSDENSFAARRVSLDRQFLSWMTTIRRDFHLAITAGLLEEMYGGGGGEVLYRPFRSPLAVGAEVWQAYKRDPAMDLNLGFTGEKTSSGHINFYYEIPQSDMTAFLKVGRYLGGDVGATAGMETHVGGGLKLRGHVTATNGKDKDVFESTRNVYAGLELSIPLGALPLIPQGSEARAKFAQIGRDAGQVIDAPVSLYDVTEPMSYRRLGRSWQEVQN